MYVTVTSALPIAHLEAHLGAAGTFDAALLHQAAEIDRLGRRATLRALASLGE